MKEVDAPVLVTSRFRSGSTLLWRCFRECSAVTAYYEPLNPRRWFDQARRGDHVDASHRGVSDYWMEYDSVTGCDVPWSDDWHQRDLYLSPLQPAFGLQRYLNLLINSANGRAVLQFNRMDFRLHWLRLNFPTAYILHLHRNPRDQWISTFLKQQPVTQTALVRDFLPKDEFYLLQWASDLKRWFPLFDEIDHWHPYELSYAIWRMSYEYGRNFSDYSLSYEDLVSQPEETLSRLAQETNCDALSATTVAKGIDRRSVDRWKTYGDENWFIDKENGVDKMLSDYVFVSDSVSSNSSPA